MTTVENTALRLHDFTPERETFRTEVLQGLHQERKTLPCKFFYDQRGSQLFDQICDLPEYYPTRTEMAIMRQYGAEMAHALGPNCLLVEYGSGSSAKVGILLDHLADPAGYVPVDISREHLLEAAARIADAYPQIPVRPVSADYTRPFSLPVSEHKSARPVIYFPGSTIGNFDRPAARDFLESMADVCGSGGGLLIGVDLKKAPQLLEPAYNDRQGVTAAFNLNLLARINTELDGTFNLDAFEHYALYNESLGRIEMHLVSLADQQVHIGEEPICFDLDETIHTECSYKYTVDEFAAVAKSAGWNQQKVWTDAAGLFSVQYFALP